MNSAFGDLEQLDETERERWCRAWRLIRQHGGDAGRVVDSEIASALRSGDSDAVAEWHRVAQAMEALTH